MEYRQTLRRCGVLGVALLDLVYPRRCVTCGAPASEGFRAICWDCMADESYITDPYCSICGDPVAGEVHHAYVCSWCRKRAPAFRRARSAVRLRGPVRDALHVLKYERGVETVHDLVMLLEGCVRTHFGDVFFDAIAPIPLHAARRRARTFNQSALLAASLAARVGVPYEPRLLRRVRWTGTQTELKVDARRRNVAGAFCALRPTWVEGRTLLLVDDVMTTGATVNECARVLMAAGAVDVYVATVARG